MSQPLKAVNAFCRRSLCSKGHWSLSLS